MIVDRLIAWYLRQASRRYLSFKPVDTRTGLPVTDPGRSYLLYLHVPFCVVLCPFCSFHRVRFKQERAEQYFRALEREVSLAAASGFRFHEAYLGGGTPTVLPKSLARLVRILRSEHGVARVSAETNPDDLADGAEALADVGINRLSVGVQSFDDELLRQMERLEKYGNGDQIRRRLKRSRECFETLNVDMMFNLPCQTEASLQRDLDILTGDVMAAQVSFYPLMSAPTTRKAMEQAIGRVNYGRERRLYRRIVDHMLANGYKRSSAWCFSRGGSMIDEYITENEEYLGLGSGAFSYVDGKLFGSTFSINNYMRRVDGGKTGITRRSTMTTRDQMRYYLLMKLFGGSLDLSVASARFGCSFGRSLAPELLGLRLIGAIHKARDRLTLTEAGEYLWVMIMREFFASVNDFREKMRLQISAE